MKSKEGFTLTEILVVLAIIAILLSVGIPGFSQLISKQKMESARESLIDLAQQARANAVNENVATVICGSRNGENCDDDKRWQSYVIAFEDHNFNHTFDNGDVKLYRISLQNADVVGTKSRLEFNPSGAGYMGSWIYCASEHSQMAETFKLVLSLGGRVRSESISVTRCS